MNQRFLILLALATALGVAACGDDTTTISSFEPVYAGDESFVRGDLGTLSLTGQDSAPITISVPEGAASMAVIVTGSGDVFTQPGSIIAPDGAVIFDVDEAADNPHTNRSDAFPVMNTTLIPANPGVTLTPGDWQMTFFSSAPVDVQVQAVVRLDQDVSTGTLDLNVHFAGVEGLDAATAPDDADFQAVLDGVRGLYADVGVSLGEVSYFDVTDEQFFVIESTAVGSDELLALLETGSAGRGDRAVNLFFVQDIENSDSARSLLGVAGGVPGPPGLHGLPRSGVAISAANFVGARGGDGDLEAAKTDLVTVTAHELGHFLGLYHTTEANGLNLGGANGFHGQDPIGDTPLCEDSADADEDLTLSASECAGDGQNLMFWSPPRDSSRVLSAGQQEVMRRNPVVR